MGLMFFRDRHNDRFINLLIDQCEKTVEGVEELETHLIQPGQAGIEAVSVREREADEIRRILIDELHKTFITPLDREDIFNLALNVDVMLDYALSTIEEMVLLGVDADEHLSQMVKLVREETEELALAMHRLSQNPRVSAEHARRAKKLERRVDNLYRVAIADLFTQATDFEHLIMTLRRREVYRHVSNMSDRADAAADVFGMVVMKLA